MGGWLGGLVGWKEDERKQHEMMVKALLVSKKCATSDDPNSGEDSILSKYSNPVRNSGSVQKKIIENQSSL